MTTQTRMDGGFGFPLGSAAAVAATVFTVSEGAAGHHGYSLGALLVVVAVTAFLTTTRAAAGVTALAWALHAGFVLGRFGQLAFTRESAWAALLFVAAGVIGAVIGAALRSVSRETSTFPDNAVFPDNGIFPDNAVEPLREPPIRMIRTKDPLSGSRN